MATFRQRFGKSYLTSSRKIYFADCHRRLYAAYTVCGVDFRLGKRQKFKVKSAGQNIKVSHRWTVSVTIWAFVLSVAISALTSGAEELGLFPAIGVLLLIVVLGIAFDIAGVAVSTASEEPFHAMAARKIAGARESVAIIRSAQQISSLCNDVIGDIAGIISGAMTTAIVVTVCGNSHDTTSTMLNLVFAGIVAALMIGGKAAGKGLAMKNNNTIVFIIGKSVYYLKKIFFIGSKRKKKK